MAAHKPPPHAARRGAHVSQPTQSLGTGASRRQTCARREGVTPRLKIAINSTPTHFFGTRYPIECQKVSYTLYIVSKSVLYALYSVKKCLIHSINCNFQSWCFSLNFYHLLPPKQSDAIAEGSYCVATATRKQI